MSTSTSGRSSVRRLHEPAIHRVRIGEDPHHLDEAGDGEAAKVANEASACGLEPIAAEPEHVDGGFARPQRFDERAGVQIAGGLAARQHHAHAFNSPSVWSVFSLICLISLESTPRAPLQRFARFRSAESRSIWRIGMRSNSAKPTPLRSLHERLGIADEDHRQPVGPQVVARHSLDIVRRHAANALGIGLQLLERQLVKELIQHLRGNRVGRFDRQREMPGKIILRPFELAFEDALALQLVELVDRKAKRLRLSRRCACRFPRRCRRRSCRFRGRRTRRRSARAEIAAPAAADWRLRRRGSSLPDPSRDSQGGGAGCRAGRCESRSAPRRACR